MEADIFRILSNHLLGDTALVSNAQDLFTIAESHQVSAIVYYQTKDIIFRQSYLHTISVFAQRCNLLNQIKERLGDIPFYLVKGVIVSEYYPIPQLRTMGDCDIVVHKSDKEKVRQILVSMGFTDKTGKWNDKEWHFEKFGLDFELHHELLYDEATSTKKEIKFGQSAWNYVHDNELDANYHFVYLLIHLKKHLLNQGVGVRQFMDLAAMGKNAKLDERVISDLLHQVDLERFAGICSVLCLHWYGVSLPVKCTEVSVEFYDYATSLILANGVFGDYSSNSDSKKLISKINKTGKLRVLLAYMFPSYQTYSRTNEYRWVKGRKFLLPVLWGYRIVTALPNRKIKSSVHYINSVIDSGVLMDQYKQDLSKWGL